MKKVEEGVLIEAPRLCRPIEPGMTLPSLCSAIRSQLHFSQITAWTDLLSGGEELRDNPRVTFGRLDIFYRVKSYDAVSNFENVPLVHNFPNVRLDDGVAVQVCLKSLPRQEGIPKLNEREEVGGVAVREERELMSAVPCCTEKGKHRCTFDEESPTEILGGMDMMPSVVHREKQLQKYRKRLMRRDKKKMKQSGEEEGLGGRGGWHLEEDLMVPREESQEDGGRKLCYGQVEKGLKPPINDLRPPLYFTSAAVEMARTPPIPPPRSASLATQTATVVHDAITVSTQTDIMDCFPHCDLCNSEMQYICWNCDSKVMVNLTDEDLPRQQLNKADLLLQAMQRTALAKCRTPTRSPQHTCEPRSCDTLPSGDLDCRLGKRQKIKHIYGTEADVRKELSQFDEMSLDVVKNDKDFSIEDQYKTPQANNTAPLVLNTPPRQAQNDSFMGTSGVINTVKSSLSRVRNLPKINLSSVFGDDRRGSQAQEHKSSPIPIRNIFNFDVMPDPECDPVVPVQKSNSAPTFNGGPHTLSPRFIKSAAIYKRRSRHLSDRSSERSSIGSDEQISDDDLTLDSPMTSPIKVSSSSAWKLPFGRRGLLGKFF